MLMGMSEQEPPPPPGEPGDGPRCPVRRLLLKAVLRRRLGIVFRYRVRRCCNGYSIEGRGGEE